MTPGTRAHHPLLPLLCVTPWFFTVRCSSALVFFPLLALIPILHLRHWNMFSTLAFLRSFTDWDWHLDCMSGSYIRSQSLGIGKTRSLSAFLNPRANYPRLKLFCTISVSTRMDLFGV